MRKRGVDLRTAVEGVGGLVLLTLIIMLALVVALGVGLVLVDLWSSWIFNGDGA